jgi:hypothetical protein
MTQFAPDQRLVGAGFSNVTRISLIVMPLRCSTSLRISLSSGPALSQSSFSAWAYGAKLSLAIDISNTPEIATNE